MFENTTEICHFQTSFPVWSWSPSGLWRRRPSCYCWQLVFGDQANTMVLIFRPSYGWNMYRPSSFCCKRWRWSNI